MPEDQLRDHATRLARVEQRVEDLALSVQAIAPLVAQHAELNAQVGHIRSEIHAVRQSIALVEAAMREREREDQEDREHRSEREAQDRRSRRNAYIAGGFAITVQLIAVIGAIVTVLLNQP